MDALMMLSPVATFRCQYCGGWSWLVGDPLLDTCSRCGEQLPAYPRYVVVWDDVRPWG